MVADVTSSLSAMNVCDRIMNMSETKHDDVGAVSLLDEPVRRRLYDWVVAQGRPVGREEAAKAVKDHPLVGHLPSRPPRRRRTARRRLPPSHRQGRPGRRSPGAGVLACGRDFNVSLPERRYDRVAQLFASALERLASESGPAPLEEAARELGQSWSPRLERRGSPVKRFMAALKASGYEPVDRQERDDPPAQLPLPCACQRTDPLVCGTNLAMAQGIASGGATTGLRPVLDSQPGYAASHSFPMPTCRMIRPFRRGRAKAAGDSMTQPATPEPPPSGSCLGGLRRHR